MQTIVIRGSRFENIKEIHEFLADALCFPDYYGKNLDALHDVLGELPRTEEVQFVVLFSGKMKENLTSKLEKLVMVLEDSAAENPNLQVIAADEREE